MLLRSSFIGLAIDFSKGSPKKIELGLIAGGGVDHQNGAIFRKHFEPVPTDRDRSQDHDS